jgi:hypothetical protein
MPIKNTFTGGFEMVSETPAPETVETLRRSIEASSSQLQQRIEELKHVKMPRTFRPGSIENLMAWILDHIPQPPQAWRIENIRAYLGNTYSDEEVKQAFHELRLVGLISTVNGWHFQRRRK